jgi:ABC-type transporter Mla subunit MlaD
MQAILQNIAGKLTAIAIILILAYIGYNEFFRGSRVGDELNAALSESRQIQTDLRAISGQMKAQKVDLDQAIQKLDRMSTSLVSLADSVSQIKARYVAVSSQLEQQIAVSLDRYNQQKKKILDIQKQIK